MTKFKSVLFFKAIALLFITNGYSQRNDAGLWLSLELDKPLTQRFSLQFKHTERFAQNITQWDLSYSDLGLGYNFTKHIEGSLNYRFINKFNPDYGIGIRHRFYGELIFKKKIRPFIFAFRQRFQNQLEDVYKSEDGLIHEYYTRSKLTIKYDLNRFAPYVASELYFKLVPGEQPLPNRYRVFLGSAYKINKTNKFSVYYLFDRRFNKKDPLTNYVIGVNYKHTFY